MAMQNFFIIEYSNGMVHGTDRASAGTASAVDVASYFLGTVRCILVRRDLLNYCILVNLSNTIVFLIKK